MDKNLRWRVLAILAVVALSVWGFYPPQQKVRLGLDLQGGVHLVLRVQTNDALRLDTETTMEQLREAAEAKGLANLTFSPVDPTRFRVEGIPQGQDAAFREAAVDVETRFNRESGTGGSYGFVMKPNLIVQLREDGVSLSFLYVVADSFHTKLGEGASSLLPFLPPRDASTSPETSRRALSLSPEDRALLLSMSSSGIRCLTLEHGDDLVRSLSSRQAGVRAKATAS